MPSMNIDRCFHILEILCNHPGGMALGDLAAQADIPKSATHRMLGSLADAGYVTQLPSKDYRLTLALAGLGFRFLSNSHVLDEAQFVLDQLAREVGELVRMSLVNDNTLLWVAKAQGAKTSLVIDPVMGQKVVLHATATGKVWLASLTTEEALKLVLQAGFGTPEDHGPNVIQSVEALQEELKKTAAREYGLAIEEADPGLSAIAVGIRSGDTSERVVGTLSIAGPTTRMPLDRLEAHVPRLKDAAAQLQDIEVLMKFAEAS